MAGSDAWAVATKVATIAQSVSSIVDVASGVSAVIQKHTDLVDLKSEVAELDNVMMHARLVKKAFDNPQTGQGQNELTRSSTEIDLNLCHLKTKMEDAQEQCPTMRDTTSIFGGASEKIKVAEKSKDGIRDCLHNLDSAVNRATLKFSLQFSDEMKEMMKLLQEIKLIYMGDFNVASTPKPDPSSSGVAQTQEVPLLTRLDAFAAETTQRHIETIETAPFQPKSAKWSMLAHTRSSTAPNHRGSVAGDYELLVNSKIRVTMKAQETRHFYILTTDSSNPSPKILFPTRASMKNELSDGKQRQFPNKLSFGDDPGVWMMTKSKHVQRKQIETCCAYFVFTKARILGTDNVELNLEHLKERLSADSESVAVEVLKFLVL